MVKEKLKELADKIADSLTNNPDSWEVITKRSGIHVRKGTITIGTKSGAMFVENEGLPFFPDKNESANYYNALEIFATNARQNFMHGNNLKSQRLLEKVLSKFKI